ncbi:fumarylacetoacetate hydrolase family protein [Parapusillimonas sp. SGNA-6]|nr:fumarylacetoacetate hydrolase family protein [Parapusillimonas sp. SGNA-6]
MKIGAIEVNGQKCYGEVRGNQLYPFKLKGVAVTDLISVIEAQGELKVDDTGYDLEKYQLVAPVGPLRKNIFCVGKNYVDHSKEFAKSGFDNSAADLPSDPIIFTKAPTTVANPNAAIRADADPTGTVDYEGELGVIIGRRCTAADTGTAYDYVFGYTIVNDVTSRELQRKHGQWFIGKNLDGYCPVGPVVVTADEFGPLDEIWLKTHVNGEERQAAQLKDLIFDVPTIIATISAYCTLEPGDLIATGTPAGVGIGFTPPRYLAPGDRVSVSVDRIGELVNTVV